MKQQHKNLPNFKKLKKTQAWMTLKINENEKWPLSYVYIIFKVTFIL